MNTTLKKRSFSLFLSFLLILSSLPFAVFTASAVLPTSYNPFTEDGSGTAQTANTVKNPFVPNGKPKNNKQGTSEDNPFFLDTVDDLLILSAIVNAEQITLTNGTTTYGNAEQKFDCSGYYFKVVKNIGSKHHPFKNRIGTGAMLAFNGSFDGSAFTIYLDINMSSSIGVGLFGCTNTDATVKNVKVDGEVKGYQYVGGIIGCASVYEEGTTVENCCNNAIVKGNQYIGGICGQNLGQSIIVNCYNTAIIKATGMDIQYIGGISGSNGGTIANCYNSGEITCKFINDINYCGGITGNVYEGTMVNCYNRGNVNINIGNVGGVSGGAYNANIAYCYYDMNMCPYGITAIGENKPDTTNVLGLPHEQCVAPSGSTVPGGFTIDSMTTAYPLIDALNAYVTAYNAKVDKAPTLLAEGALSATEFTPDTVITPDKLKYIKLCYWDKQTGDYYPQLSKATKEKPLTSVNVNMFLAKPAIGCRLLNAKAFSKTANVNVTNVRTTWFDGTHRIATKAHLGGKYTAMVSFKLAPAPEYDVADGAKVWVWIDRRPVPAVKVGDDTYMVRYTFKKLSICNVLSDIYKNLFWRIF